MSRKVDESGQSQAVRIRAYAMEHPNAEPKEIAEIIGCRHQVVLRVLRPTRTEPNDEDIACLAYLACFPGNEGIGEERNKHPGTRLRARWAPLHTKPGTVREFTFKLLQDMDLMLQYDNEKYCPSEIGLEYLHTLEKRIITFKHISYLGKDEKYIEDRWCFKPPAEFAKQARQHNQRYDKKTYPYYEIAKIDVVVYPETFEEMRALIYNVDQIQFFKEYGYIVE